MNKKFENRNSMGIVTHEFIRNLVLSVLNASPGLSDDIIALGTVLEEIKDLNEFQTINRSGYRIVKSQSKDVMAVNAIDVVDALRGYANVTNNEVLFSEMELTYWDIMKKRDSEARDTCTFIHTRGVEHASGIATYGISEEVLLNFKNYIVEFESNMAKPRLTIAERMQLTKGLEMAFERLDGVLEDMDAKVFALRFLYPEVVSNYKDCRKIVNYRGSVLSVSGKVYDEGGLPLYGATIVLKEADRFAKSTYKGNFEFKNVANGTYTVVVSRPGYETQEVTAGIVKGETTRLAFLLKVVNGFLRNS